jgi:hypothetical protein
MPISARIALTAALLTATTSVASAQFGGGSLHGTSVGISANSPTGDFAKTVQNGFGITIHTGAGDPGETWSGRGSFGFDRFGGKGALDNVQFIAYGFDIVHHSTSGFYQFGGVGLNSTTYNYKTTTDAGAAGTRNGQNFGLTGGIGMNLGSSEGVHAFIEVAATTLFTSPKNSAWFPIRFGIQF